MVKKYDRSFLLGADLSAEQPVGRRAKAKALRAERESKQRNEELPAEKRPRTQQAWLEEERKRTALPKQAAGKTPEGDSAGKMTEEPTEGMGRKKAKKLAMHHAKQALKEEKKMKAQRNATKAAAEAVTSKVKQGEVSRAAAAMLASCPNTAASQQHLLSLVAERITGEPEKELDLFDVFLDVHRRGQDLRTRQLALLSAVAVFRDLVPGYRIREPTEEENKIIKSKGVLALQRFEMSLLQKYRQLLPLLEAGMKSAPMVVAPALAALVWAAADFNYRQRLIGTAVKHANSSNPEVRKICASGLRSMVETDSRLEASREVVLAIGRIAQSASRKGAGKKKEDDAENDTEGGSSLCCEIVEVLLDLPIGKAESAKLFSEAVPDEADDETRRNLGEASISHGDRHLRKAETELLTETFIVYLRILRQRNVHSRRLLAAVLTGLARWGQQVNLELLLEILAELRGAVQDAITQSDELVALQGLNCALVLLSGPSQALMTDVTWLADALKSALVLALPSLHGTHSECAVWPPPRCYGFDGEHLTSSDQEMRKSLESESVPALVLRCLDAALKCPQAYGRASDAALAQLIEQLCTLALTADSHVGMTFLREAALLLRKHHRLHTLLDVEGGLFGLGGISDHLVTVVWHLQPFAFGLAPESEKAARNFAGFAQRRHGVPADIFPFKNGQEWLMLEVGRHLATLGRTPRPQPRPKASHGRGKAAGAPSMLSESELSKLCGC